MLASHNLSGYCSNSLIIHCFIQFRYHLEPKWMLAGPQSKSVIAQIEGSMLFQKPSECFTITLGFALGDYETFLRFLKQCRTFNLSNNLYITETINLISLGINQIINHKQGALVPLLSKCHCYACAYTPIASYAIALKITTQPL